MSQRVLRGLARCAVAATTVAVAATTLAAPAVAGERERDRSAATAWLADELEAGRYYNEQFDFTDWGLTVDGLFALAADPDRGRATARVGRALRAHVDDYASPGDGRSAGATAKLLVAARVLRDNARSFGGHNLRQELLRLADTAGADQGRFEDTGPANYSNTISQAYGVIGLSRSGGARPATVDYLLKQRCPDGYFRLFPDSTCTAANADVDATALAVQALVAADRKGGVQVADRVIERSGSWLARAQRNNGGFSGSGPTAGTNTNSTGVAAQALQLTGHDGAVRQAARYVARLQVERSDDRPLRRDRGAIAYNADALRTARRDGITVKTTDQFRRATTQAVFALKPAPLVSLTARR